MIKVKEKKEGSEVIPTWLNFLKAETMFDSFLHFHYGCIFSHVLTEWTLREYWVLIKGLGKGLAKGKYRSGAGGYG